MRDFTPAILLHTLAVRQERIRRMGAFMSTWDANAAESRALAMGPAQNRLAQLERENQALRQQQPAAVSGPPKGIPQMAPPTGPKRTGIMRALAAHKAQGEIDAKMDALADLAEKNNERAIELADAGIRSETAKAALLEQMAREHALDELESLIGANGPPPGPLPDTPPPPPPGAAETVAMPTGVANSVTITTVGPREA